MAKLAANEKLTLEEIAAKLRCASRRVGSTAGGYV